MSNLVPTPITDKNGKQTTVHKRFSRFSGKTASIPAPVQPPQRPKLSRSHRKALIRGLHPRVGRITSGYSAKHGKSYKDCVRDLLKGYKDEALIAVNGYLGDARNIPKKEEYRLLFIRELVDQEHDDGTIALEYIRLVANLDTDIDPHEGFKILRGLHACDQLPTVSDYVEADPAIQEQVVALVETTAKVHRYRYQQRFSPRESWTPPQLLGPLPASNLIHATPHLRLDDSLIAAIIKNPSEGEYIANLIIKEGVDDLDLIRERAESKTPALREGLL